MRPVDAVARVTEARDGALTEEVHHARTAAILGVALGVSFLVCFGTGLLSHLIQQPPDWFRWSPRPAGLYRVTQGVHVTTGLATIPLLLAKLWSVFPQLFKWPPLSSVAHAVERVMLVPLVCGSVFMSWCTRCSVAGPTTTPLSTTRRPATATRLSRCNSTVNDCTLITATRAG